MAKIAQLIEAGDYLVYKGDWVTNTAYNVNDIVTWNNNGHLYEVIKAHTSSASIKPDNTEYYKAMTATKYKQYTFNLSTESERINLTSLSSEVQNGKRMFIIDNDGFIYEALRASGGTIEFGYTYVVSDASHAITRIIATSIKVLGIYAKKFTMEIDTSGTVSTNTTNMTNTTVLIEN